MWLEVHALIKLKVSVVCLLSLRAPKVIWSKLLRGQAHVGETCQLWIECKWLL